jgi:putative nucleotidyltransferase with HDIG domain
VVGQSVPRLEVRWAALFHDIGKVKTRSISPTGEVHFFGHAEVTNLTTATRSTQRHSHFNVNTFGEIHSRDEHNTGSREKQEAQVASG